MENASLQKRLEENGVLNQDGARALLKVILKNYKTIYRKKQYCKNEIYFLIKA